jgi:hypothetical protein
MVKFTKYYPWMRPAEHPPSFNLHNALEVGMIVTPVLQMKHKV